MSTDKVFIKMRGLVLWEIEFGQRWKTAKSEEKILIYFHSFSRKEFNNKLKW